MNILQSLQTDCYKITASEIKRSNSVLQPLELLLDISKRFCIAFNRLQLVSQMCNENLHLP